MSAQDLSYSEILDATVSWTTGPVRAFLTSSPIAQPYLGTFDALRITIGNAPPEDAPAESDTAALAQADGAHDKSVRFICAFLGAFAHSASPELVEQARTIGVALLPDGVTLVRKSFAEEAGRADTRAAALTPEMRALLASFPLPAGGTLADAFDQLQAQSRRLGELLALRRTTESSGSPSATDYLTAKRNIIALVEQVLHAFHVLDATLDATGRTKVAFMENAWRNAIRTATENAARRRAGTGDPPPPVTPPATP